MDLKLKSKNCLLKSKILKVTAFTKKQNNKKRKWNLVLTFIEVLKKLKILLSSKSVSTLIHHYVDSL